MLFKVPTKTNRYITNNDYFKFRNKHLAKPITIHNSKNNK